MKRNNLIFAVFAATVVAAASCNKERAASPDLDGGVPAGSPMTITAGVDSKIYYKGGVTVCWAKDDKLRVFNESGDGTTFTTSTSGEVKAVFTCADWPGGTPVFAVHSAPDSYVSGCTYLSEDGPKVNAYLNPSQSIVQKLSFSKTAGLSVGLVGPDPDTEGSYKIDSLKNVFASIGFTVEADSVESVTLRGNNDEDLAGWVDVDYNNGMPIWNPSSVEEHKTSQSIKVAASGNASDKGTFISGSKYYINVLPQTFSKGITLILEKTNGAKAVRKIESEIVLERNEKRSFSKALDDELPYDSLTIHFTTDWPFVEEIVSPNSQKKTGESGEIYTYNYTDGGEEKSCQFEIANPATPEGKTPANNKYYQDQAKGFLIRFNDPGKGSWIKLPAIEGRKLFSVKVTVNNSSNKGFFINTTPSASNALFSANIGVKTGYEPSATYFSSKLKYKTSYYIYINGNNFQLADLELIYSK